MAMMIACKAHDIQVPHLHVEFPLADTPQEVSETVGGELLKMGLFYKWGKKIVIKEENHGSSFSNFTTEEVDE